MNLRRSIRGASCRLPLGAYLAWSLICAEVLFAAAKTKDMPSAFAKENNNKVPANALWITKIVIQLVVITTYWSRDAFALMLNLTIAMSLITFPLRGGLRRLGHCRHWDVNAGLCLLGAFFPICGDGTTIPALIGASVILWLTHLLILRGVKEAAALNTIATVAKIVPLVIFIGFVIFGFKASIFTANFWGGEEPNFRDIYAQVRSTMLLTVFVFVGIEGASVYSRYAKNRNDVGVATVLGFLGVLSLLVMVTILSYGVLLRPDLAALRTPSMAGVMAALVGPWGAAFISIGLLISVLGNYLSWSMLAAEVMFSAARHRTMPNFLARQNKNEAPVAALWTSNILIQLFLITI